MTRKTRSFRPSPALVISCVALFLTLAGTAFAAPRFLVRSAQIVDATVRTVDLRDNAVSSPKIADATVTVDDLGTDSVGSDEIAKDAVKSDEIADNAVASAEVAPDSLTAGDLAANSVGGSEVADGSLTQADLGINSVAASELGTTTVRTKSEPIAAGANGSIAIACPGNEQVLSGGGAPSAYGVEMTSNAPSGNGWFYAASNKTGAAQTITVYALCLN
ncbi:MAG TPA: hypothetical protein VFM94_09040 [Solirubrobacterales bacterium]|nr:hypothetical protein [Solirubrobacterales bacterium]